MANGLIPIDSPEILYRLEGRPLLVSFVQRGEMIRIISARTADADERKRHEEANDDLRSHYDFDYSKMKPNRFAGEKKICKNTYGALDEDVSKVFQSSDGVNTALRSAMRTMRTAPTFGQLELSSARSRTAHAIADVLEDRGRRTG